MRQLLQMFLQIFVPKLLYTINAQTLVKHLKDLPSKIFGKSEKVLLSK